MISNEVGVQLHHRATLGLPLSAEERASLEAWYARQDAEEAAQLAAARVPSLAALREQISARLAEISAVSQRIQTISRENEALRNEIAVLERRLTQQGSGQ